jgi:hypothetical protein
MLNLLFWYSAFVKIAEELRTSVYEETGLTCSAGVGPNRLLAKVLLAILLIFSLCVLSCMESTYMPFQHKKIKLRHVANK